MDNPKVKLLTDDLIYQYSENNILTEYRDINLKIDYKLAPYPGGVYDQDIFGSLFCDRCNCGNIKTPGIRCPRCNSMILDPIQSYRHFARIESPVYYLNRFKLDKVVKFLKDNFYIKPVFNSPKFSSLRWNDSTVLNICQWELDKENEDTLIITDNVTDFRKCSFEGLIEIMSVNYPDKLEELRSYLNKYILVIPVALRAPSIRKEDGKWRLDNTITTNIYKSIIYAIHEYYPVTFPTIKSELSKAIFRGSLRKLISNALDGMSQLMNSSRQNLARLMQGNRLDNSGRCVIVPDPTLKADEVVIPRFVMYEICRSEFVDYLAKNLSISDKEAEIVYRTQSDQDQVQELFTKFIEGNPDDPDSGKYVMINRQPTLYALGVGVCKVRLSSDYAMKIPQVLCSPFNADFDGDQMALYDIPLKLNPMMKSTLSPKNQFFYKKSHSPLYTPTHEFMMGLLLATKLVIPDKIESFSSIDEALEFKKSRSSFKYQTVCIIAGKKTTLGRAILGELFDKDLDAYIEMTKSASLNSKNVTLLYAQLTDKEDRLDRIQKIQEFAAKIATLSGATAPRLSELYIDIDKEYLDKIKKLEEDPTIDKRAKELAIRDIYKEYQSVEMEKIPEGVRTAITESSRAKLDQLRDMAIQQLNVSPNHEFYVGGTTLVGGLSPIDLVHHAIENRAVQDIKQLSVPQSGYLTRQFTYAASEYTFRDGTDESNKGIEIKMKDAIGRTKLDGTIVTNNDSNDIIKVRSIITSTLDKGIFTSDMISNLFKYKDGDRIGMGMITSLTESLTQKGLSLKHNGSLFGFDPNDSNLAPEDGTVEVTDNWVIFHGKSKVDYKYPKCTELVINYTPNGKYKKGEKFMTNYHPVTPAYGLDSVIKLCQARTTNGTKKFQNNKKLVSECYAIEPGIIKYDINDGWVTVHIGDIEYAWNPDVIYKYPEGTKIDKYQRFCTGTLDMKSYVYKVEDYVDLYYFFRNQFNELMPGIASELIEFLYALLVKSEDNQNQMKSVLQTIYGSESFFKSLAFGDARKSFEKIDYKGLDFVADPITAVILPLIVNDELK